MPKFSELRQVEKNLTEEMRASEALKEESSLKRN